METNNNNNQTKISFFKKRDQHNVFPHKQEYIIKYVKNGRVNENEITKLPIIKKEIRNKRIKTLFFKEC